jgi:hypothetical protein
MATRWVAGYYQAFPPLPPCQAITMSRAIRNDGLDKFRRYRANQRARGMKLLRLWVPDPTAPGFADEAHRQAALLRGTP